MAVNRRGYFMSRCIGIAKKVFQLETMTLWPCLTPLWAVGKEWKGWRGRKGEMEEGTEMW